MMRRNLIGKVAGGTAVLLLTLYTILALRSKPIPAHPFFVGQDGPIILAHQGGEELMPSNTLPAFQNAVDLGVEVLEMDIHATRDGILVVMHDATVDRTTNGSGAIKEMTFAEIRQLDAGDYWTNDNGHTYPYRAHGFQVPSLEELLQTFPNQRMNIEIKQSEPSLVPTFCQMLRDYQMTDQVLVASFHQQPMLEMRQTCPEVATSMVQAEIQPFWVLNLLGLSAIYQSPAEAFQVPETFALPLIGEVQVITPRFVRNAHRHNIQVHVWTINDTAEMQRMLATGVDGIITDRPDRLLSLLH